VYERSNTKPQQRKKLKIPPKRREKKTLSNGYLRSREDNSETAKKEAIE